MNPPISNSFPGHALSTFPPPAKKRVGPTAPDFHTAIQLDPDDTLTLEEASVALAAIQRMNAKLEIENASLKEDVASLKERLELLDQLVVSLMKKNRRIASKHRAALALIASSN